MMAFFFYNHWRPLQTASNVLELPKRSQRRSLSTYLSAWVSSSILMLAGVVIVLGAPRFVDASDKPRSISFIEALKYSDSAPIPIPDSGLTIRDIPQTVQLIETRTGLSASNYIDLLALLSAAKVAGESSSSSSLGLLIDVFLKGTKHMARLGSDGLVQFRQTSEQSWTTLFVVRPESVPYLVGLIGVPQCIALVNHESALQILALNFKCSPSGPVSFQVKFNDGGAGEASSSSVSSSSTVLRFTTPNQEQGETADGNDNAPSFDSDLAGNNTASSSINGKSSSPTSGQSKKGQSQANDLSGRDGAKQNEASKNKLLTTPDKGSQESASSTAFSAKGEQGPRCKFVAGPGPVHSSVLPSDPTMADTSDVQHEAFAGGVVRLALGTAITSLGSINVGQVATLGVDSSNPQSILNGYAWTMNEAIGLLLPRALLPRAANKNGSTTKTSQARGGVLYLGGLGYPQEAKGFDGFEWEPKTTGQNATVELRGAGTLNSALLTFGMPNRLGYAPIQKIELAHGVTITYQYMNRWNVAITLNDPQKGTTVTRYSQQPSDDPALIEVVKTFEVGNTLFELEKFTFTEIAPSTIAVSGIKNLMNGSTYALAWHDDLIPAQWASAQHAEFDNSPLYTDAIPKLKNVSGAVDIQYRGTSGPQQVPGTTPYYTHRTQEVILNHRQFSSGTAKFQGAMFQSRGGTKPIKVGSTFVDHTNRKSNNGSVANLYDELWSSKTRSWPAETTTRGATLTFKYNDVGAVLEKRMKFTTNGSWTSKYERDAYWIKSASLYNGMEYRVTGDPKYPSSFSLKTPVGTYQVSMTWQEYKNGQLTQMLLTSYTEVAPSGRRHSTAFTWNGDHLASILYNDGTTTSIDPTSITSYAASGAERVRLMLEQRFDSISYADPMGFRASSTLSSGILQSFFHLNADLIRQQRTEYGMGTTKAGGFTIKNLSGSGQGVGGYTSQNSSTKEGFGMMMSLTTDNGGQSKAVESQGDHSAAEPAGSCELNGNQVTQGACSVTYISSPLAKASWSKPALGIDAASIVKEVDPNTGGESFAVLIAGSNNTAYPARPLIVNDQRGANQLEPFSLAGAGDFCDPYFSLEGIKKAKGLPCEVPPSTTDLPSDIRCPISKEAACPSDGGEAMLEIVLAAGEPCNLNDKDPKTGYLNPPQFCAEGTIDGFIGVLSNRYLATAVPGTCS